MTLAGIELRYLVNDISQKTAGYYVSNIYGINRDSILFKLHHPEKQDILLMISSFGLWISSVKIEQVETNKLLKRLRNDLLRLKLTKIEQIGAERIAYLKFSGFDKEFVIVCEFFGNGNMLLCNNDMKILALSHSIDVRHRKLNVGLNYEPPPQNGINVFDFTENDLEGISSVSMSSVKWIGRTLGLPAKYAEEIFRITEINPKTPGNELSRADIKKIFTAVNDLVKKVITGNHDPVIVRTENKIDVYPIKLGLNSNKEFVKVTTFNEGLDQVFTENIIKKGKDTQAGEADTKILELENKLAEQTKAIEVVKKKSKEIADVAKLLMKLVSQGITTIEDPSVKEALKKHNSEVLKEKGVSLIKINDEKIKINPLSSIPTIASSLFDSSKRQSGAISSIETLKKKTEKSLENQRNKVKQARKTVSFSEIRKKNWYERYRWFFTSDGLLAIGGRDSSSNSAIIRKHVEKNDKVFHADIYGSPFFVLKDAKSVKPSSLKETAHATVCFSRAWREAMYGLNAYWVEPEQVKKAAPSGQFLAKGAFIIDGQRNFVNISTLKLAIGLVKQDSNFILSCGPPEPIKKNCLCYSIIEPGGSEMVDVAKKIKSEFVKIKDEVKTFNLDEFVRVLPAGKSHVVESGLGQQSNE